MDRNHAEYKNVLENPLIKVSDIKKYKEQISEYMVAEMLFNHSRFNETQFSTLGGEVVENYIYSTLSTEIWIELRPLVRDTYVKEFKTMKHHGEQ